MASRGPMTEWTADEVLDVRFAFRDFADQVLAAIADGELDGVELSAIQHSLEQLRGEIEESHYAASETHSATDAALSMQRGAALAPTAYLAEKMDNAHLRFAGGENVIALDEYRRIDGTSA